MQHIWKRKKLHYWSTANNDNDDGESSTAIDCVKRLEKLGIKIPEMRVKSINRKYVECSRHVKQLFVRGEQIAVITLDETSK